MRARVHLSEETYRLGALDRQIVPLATATGTRTDLPLQPSLGVPLGKDTNMRRLWLAVEDYRSSAPSAMYRLLAPSHTARRGDVTRLIVAGEQKISPFDPANSAAILDNIRTLVLYLYVSGTGEEVEPSERRR